jgi:hypothetical protein
VKKIIAIFLIVVGFSGTAQAVELKYFALYPDRNRNVHGTVIEPSMHVNNYVLVAGDAQTVNIPTGAKWVLFSCTGNFYTNFHGATAAEPSTNATNGAGVELNPTVRYLGSHTSFSVVAPANAILTLAYYK